MFDLKEQNVRVAGASSGIGLAAARLIDSMGATVPGRSVAQSTPAGRVAL